ncbi:hypothetical protein O9992_25935 [Vibrio lentus]|nr:hypothetical protein [Vibrio lentus]
MMKNKLSTTPANYALLVHLCRQRYPQLTKDMDGVLEHYGICPPAFGRTALQQLRCKANLKRISMTYEQT